RRRRVRRRWLRPPRRRTVTRRQAGRLGGLQTLSRHGREHMRAIGRAGFNATVARHWQGDRAGYREWLAQRQHLAAIERAADFELDRQLDTAALVACIELSELPY